MHPPLADFEQPFYACTLDIRDCTSDIRINDCPIHQDYEGMRAQVEIPINGWLRHPSNRLSCELAPFPRELEFCPTSFVQIRLTVREYSEKERHELCVLRWQPGQEFARAQGALVLDPEDGFVTPRNKGRVWELQWPFEFHFPLPLWGWMQAPVLTSNPQTFESLCVAYQRLHRIYESEEREALLDARREQLREMALACYEDSESMEEDLLDNLEIVRNASMKLQPFEPEFCELLLYGEGRLATLVDDEGDSPIYFLDEENDWAAVIKAMFYQNQEREWVLIR